MVDPGTGENPNGGNGGVPWQLIALGAVILFALVFGALQLAYWREGGLQGIIGRLGGPTPSPAALALAPTPIPTSVDTPTPPPTVTPSRTSTPSPTSTPTPTPTPTPIVVITDLRALGRLETAQYAMQTVVDLERAPETLLERLAGTDQLLLIAEGEVVAGFDLEKVEPSDIVVQGTAVTLTLPAPEILYSRVDNDKTYVYERRTGVLRRPDPNLETEARRLAEQRLVDWALERGILAQASKFGIVYLEGFLRSLGLRDITIRIRDNSGSEN